VSSYAKFIEGKSQLAGGDGFDPIWLPDWLKHFQAHMTDWSIRRGRSAMFADCGMGKTPMQLVWSENVIRHTNKPVLLLAPIAVGQQTKREGDKFGIDCVRSIDGKFAGPPRVVITNYERLKHFSPDDFGGVVCDESGILKNFDGKTRDEVVEFMRTVRYRLLCTATAAPNDYVELGNSSEAVGELGFHDMVTKFFKKETSKDHLGWGRTKYRMRGHAERDFWRWVCSWARAVRKPSDLGYDDDGYDLPPLNAVEHTITARNPRPGRLFDTPAETLEEQREERRRTLPERCEKVAELVNGTGSSAAVWCHLNDEGDRLVSLIPGSVQVSGSDSDERKEEVFEGFASGQIRVIVTKPSIAGFGLNWQHCHHQTFFPSHSFEQYYQAVRRSWRFGQEHPVTVDIVTSEGEAGVLANLNRKAAAADDMFARLVELMNDTLQLKKVNQFTRKERLPKWLSSSK
jgi:hypothetical protein